MRPPSVSPVLATLANVFRIPLSQSALRPTIPLPTHQTTTLKTQQSSSPPTTTTSLLGSSRPFSTTPPLLKRKVQVKPDKRVTLIRYFLHHPLTPRPLRFSRTRYLRHWTIQRAWNLYQASRRRNTQLELQRQWQAMSAACEELRTGAGDGGKLFRKSMIKTGIYQDMFPIEYARLQTERPGEGWNHEWKRPEGWKRQ
ncbi:hypothetical protein BJX61DRAFT_533758 [Aspergillus egyptiacus]|nr:hypothetical protein BJX61DRAFT_533758 [Aspergillus egyptiacus]